MERERSRGSRLRLRLEARRGAQRGGAPKKKEKGKKRRTKKNFSSLTSLGAWIEARVISFFRGGPLGLGGPLIWRRSPESTAETTPAFGGRREREKGKAKESIDGGIDHRWRGGEFSFFLQSLLFFSSPPSPAPFDRRRTFEPRSHHDDGGREAVE